MNTNFLLLERALIASRRNCLLNYKLIFLIGDDSIFVYKTMNILILLLGFLFLAERIGKYLLINRFFRQASLSSEEALKHEELQVSIIQPILSGDPTLWDCLSANLQMKACYSIEFVWLIDDDDAVAQSGCRQLIEQYPDANVRLISLPPPLDAISPKTFKLIAGLKEAKGEIIAVLDDDTILPDGGLDQCIPYLYQPKIGVAFGLPYYINFSNLWSTLVSCFVNGTSLLTYIPYTFAIKPFTINGMFFVVRREILDKVNGFSGLETAIVDDYAIAQRFRSYGYQLAQTPVCHGISTQVQNASHYFSLLTRWFVFPQASILKSATIQELFVFYVMVFIPTIFPLLILVYILLFSSAYSIFYEFLFLILNFYIFLKLNNNYLNNATPTNKIIFLLLVQILLPVNIFFSLLAPKKITWRGHIMQIKNDGGFQFIQRRATTDKQ